MVHVKIVLHSKGNHQMDANAKKSNVHRLKDFYQVESVKTVNHIQEPSLVEKLAHQCYVLKDKKSCQMVHVKIALLSHEQHRITEVAPIKYAQQDRCYKKMGVVLSATHTPGLMPKEKHVFHTTVTIDRNLDLMDLVLTAQILKEPKEQV